MQTELKRVQGLWVHSSKRRMRVTCQRMVIRRGFLHRGQGACTISGLDISDKICPTGIVVRRSSSVYVFFPRMANRLTWCEWFLFCGHQYSRGKVVNVE